jgi:PKD repeat protein
VDPSDDCTFWFTGEYQANDTPLGDWRTRIGSFRFPSCGLIVSVQATPAGGSVPLAVQFAAHGTGGTLPHTFAWDFGDGGAGSGETVSHTYTAAGSYTVRVTMTDGSGTAATGTAAVIATVQTPQIAGVTKRSNPFLLVIAGGNFHPGCSVRVNGTAVPQTQFVAATKLKATGGSPLKAMLPKGQAVQITVLNSDDGGVSAPFSYTR